MRPTAATAAGSNGMMKCSFHPRAIPVFRSSRGLAAPVAIALLAAACADAPSAPDIGGDGAAARAKDTIEIWSPTSGATLSGVEVFRALVPGKALSTYVMHWQVDGGPLQAMTDSQEGGAHKRGTADVSTWTNGAGPYTVNFVARDARNSRMLAQRSVTVMVSVPEQPPEAGDPSPFAGRLLWVNPNSNARRQADEWRSSRPDDAAMMDKIAWQPDAQWFGDWNTDVRAAVSQMTQTIVQAGALPLYVAFNIPLRDCGSYSAGGASSASAYRDWIRAFAQGLGATRAVVVLEPDALAGMGCLTTAQRTERLSLIDDAVSVLKAQGSAVYIDAGHSNWISATEMAARLQSAGIAKADGFSLNVSNFQTTDANITYGTALSGRVGDKRFIIDTSRNGLGPTADNQWCNPDGRALGRAPTAHTGHALVDALVWIKKPGESDGTCNGGPAAGRWWADYALGLAQRAPVMVAYGG
jgi:endoglucanase